MANETFLPPVVGELTLNIAPYTANIARAKEEMAGFVGSTDASGMGAGMTKMSENAAASAGVIGASMGKASEEVKSAEGDIEKESSGFSSRIKSTFMKTGEAMGRWGLPFGNSVTKMGEKVGEAEKHGKGFSESLVQVGKVATVVGGVALAGFADYAVKSADAFDVAQAGLQTAIKSSGYSFDALKPKISDTYSKMANLGFNSTETAESLKLLTIATQSPSKAMGDMSLAANLARTRNISLSSATGMLAKVYAGSNRALTQMGINLNLGAAKLHSVQAASEAVKNAQQAYEVVQHKVNEGTLTGTAANDALTAAHMKLSDAEHKLAQDQGAVGQVMDALTKRTHGQADAFGNTLAGSADIVKARLHNLATEFGDVLIPVMTAVVKVVGNVIGFFVKYKAAAIALGLIIGGPLVAAIGAYVAVTTAGLAKTAAANISEVASFGVMVAEKVIGYAAIAASATAAFIVENAATLGIIAGIALLVAGIVLLVTHWKAVWNEIKTIISDAVGFVKKHIEILLGVIGLPVLAMYELVKHWKLIWGEIKTIVSGAVKDIAAVMTKIWDRIKSNTTAAWDKLKSIVGKGVNAVFTFFEKLPGRVMKVLSGMLTSMEHFGVELVNSIIHGIESAPGAVVGALKKLIPGSGIIGSAAKAIGLATGGIVTKPTLAVVGEAGPEAVIPLRGTNMSPDGIRPLPTANTATPTSIGSGVHVDAINVYGTSMTPNQTINELYLKIRPLFQSA